MKMKLFRQNPASLDQIVKGNKIDIIALFNTFWFYRVSAAYFIGFIVVVTLMISIVIPAKFKASTSFIPLSEERISLGQLGNLASLAGMDLNSMVGTTSSMSSDLYPDVVQSYPFLQRLLEHEFPNRFSGESSTLQDILKTGQAKSWGKKVARYTIRLPWTVKSMLFTKEVVHEVGEGDLIVLTSEDQEVFDKLTACIEIKVDKNNGLVSISVELEDPVLAAQVTQKSLDVLQQMVIEYKTKQVRENLVFINERYQEKRSEFEEARKALNSYRDAHRNIITERTGAELQDLELEYNMASNVFQMLAQQVEQANIAVKKETPVFSIIDPVKVPLSKSSPNIGKNLFFSLIVGGFIVVMIITGKIVLFQIKH